ncbi:MAG: hypothetical protein HY077_04780 [Elusimicrobia bacterium]|nr:hypothetical protein [Elusimicrobiota bacterium]
MKAIGAILGIVLALSASASAGLTEKLGLIETGKGWEYRRLGYPGYPTQTRILDAVEVAALTAVLQDLKPGTEEQVLSAYLLKALKVAEIPPDQFPWFEPPGAMSPCGWAAVAGAILGDPWGSRFAASTRAREIPELAEDARAMLGRLDGPTEFDFDGGPRPRGTGSELEAILAGASEPPLPFVALGPPRVDGSSAKSADTGLGPLVVNDLLSLAGLNLPGGGKGQSRYRLDAAAVPGGYPGGLGENDALYRADPGQALRRLWASALDPMNAAAVAFGAWQFFSGSADFGRPVVRLGGLDWTGGFSNFVGHGSWQVVDMIVRSPASGTTATLAPRWGPAGEAMSVKLDGLKAAGDRLRLSGEAQAWADAARAQRPGGALLLGETVNLSKKFDASLTVGRKTEGDMPGQPWAGGWIWTVGGAVGF